MDFSPVRMMVRSVVPFIVHTHTIFIAEEGSFSTYTWKRVGAMMQREVHQPQTGNGGIHESMYRT